MLKGLEVSILNLSKLNKWNDRFRFDSEFVKKEYLELENKLESIPHKLLANVDCKILHPSEIKREYVEEDGVWFFRTQNIRPLKIRHSNDVYISKKDAERLSKNVIKKYDVVITRTGANFGQTALYNIEDEAIGSSHTFILRNSYFNQSYLAVFYNTEYGRKLIDKGMYGGSQPEIAPYYLSHIPIPDLSSVFQLEIEALVFQSENKINSSKESFNQSKNILLSAIELLDFESKETDNYQEISLSKSFNSTTRLDAEYYHPKPLFLIDQLKKKKYYLVKELFDIGNGYSWKSKYFKEQGEGEPFVRIRNCKPGYIDNENLTTLDSEYAKGERVEKAQENDIVIGMDGIKYFYGSLIKEPVYVNQRVCHLRPKEDSEIDSELVLMIINSVIGQTQLMREMTIAQTVGHITNASVGNLIIPKLDDKIRDEVSIKIKESHQLEKEGLNLLEIAKKAVEIAIEENEENALIYINSNISNHAG